MNLGRPESRTPVPVPEAADAFIATSWPWFLAVAGDRPEDRHRRAVKALEQDPTLTAAFVVDVLTYPKFVCLTVGERYGQRIEVTEIVYSRECKNGQTIAWAAENWSALAGSQ